MASRDEVFKSKVLRKLYPAAPVVEKEPSAPCVIQTLSKKTFMKRKTSGDAGKTQVPANPVGRLYTALPPPADHKMDAEKSVTLSQLESINSAGDPAEESDGSEGSEAPEPDKEEEQQKRKKRKKRKKTSLHQDSGQVSAGQSAAPVDGGGHMSRNRKRKLKKKRHKEKLLSLGLLPRAAALEFTYQKDGVEEEEEEEEGDNETRAAEVSDFLRTTMGIYMSDSSLRADRPPVLSATLDDLLRSIASGHKAASVLRRLCSLKAFVQQKDAGGLEEALNELRDASTLSAEETTAVVSLFQYWITDILPMRGDEKAGISTTHPQDCQQ